VKNLKSAYLSEMFPAEGEFNPKRRFPGFTDDWEQRELGKVVEITMGQSPNSSNYTDNPDDYILVQGNADMKDGRVVPRVWTTQVTKQAEKGDLILSVRAPVGDIGKTDYDVVLGRGVAAIKGNEFIFQSLGRMKEIGYWNRLSTGSTFESINSNDIKEAVIQVPSEAEQEQIGTFFGKLDNLITLHQRKLEKLQNLKQAYLNEMFV
jgi:type I restriction enzyme S subunit